MRFNINTILKSFFKNPTNTVLLVTAFGAGFVIAHKMLVSKASANAAIPQYQNESEVEYPRQFGGSDFQYTDPSGYTTPDVSNMEGNASGVDVPRVTNSYYDEVVDDYDADDYEVVDDIAESYY